AKSQTPASELVDRWRQRAERLGLDATAIEALCSHTLMIETPDPAEVFSSLTAPEGICSGGAVFSRTDALTALANHPAPTAHGDPQPLLVGAARLESVVDEFLAPEHVVQVTMADEPLFTTT